MKIIIRLYFISSHHHMLRLRIYLKNSSHFCMGVLSLQLTRVQVVAEAGLVSQVQAMLVLYQSRQMAEGLHTPAPVHSSSPPCTWALSGAWDKRKLNQLVVSIVADNLEA